MTVTGIPSPLASSVPSQSRTWCPMQRFLQLPGAVKRPGSRGACAADQEAASPVLAPEGGPPPWYQALQPEELRWLQAPEEDTTPEASLEGPCPEPGQGQSQSQPLRYRGTPRGPTQLPLSPDFSSSTSPGTGGLGWHFRSRWDGSGWVRGHSMGTKNTSGGDEVHNSPEPERGEGS